MKFQRNTGDLAIRHVRKDEWESFLRFLERAYGHGWGYFPAYYPHLYCFEDRCLKCFYVLEENGEIVSHVGLFPLEVAADGVRVKVGGIGGVATLPGARGKGYMGKLLRHVIGEMKKLSFPLSFLGGDRQRYGHFGWETAGERVVLHVTEHSLRTVDIKSVAAREVSPEEAEAKVRRLHSEQRFRVERNEKLPDILRIAGNRIWLTDNGYLCGRVAGNTLEVKEVVSLSGDEVPLTKAVMEWCFNKQAKLILRTEDTERFNRFMQVADNWEIVEEGKFRINDYFQLLKCFSPLLEDRAHKLNLEDFTLSLGIRSGEETSVVTLDYVSGRLRVSKQKGNPYVEIDEKDGVRLLLGGPFCEREKIGKLSALLPLPVHIPKLDWI